MEYSGKANNMKNLPDACPHNWTAKLWPCPVCQLDEIERLRAEINQGAKTYWEQVTEIERLRAALFQIQRMGGYAAGIAGEVLLSAPHVADEWQ